MTEPNNVHHFPLNLARGYTKSFRSKWDNPVFRDYLEVALWSYLIDFAQSEPYRFRAKNGWVELQVGEVLIAERHLATAFKMHRNTVRALLHRMTTEGMIELFRDRCHHLDGTILRIKNYVVYQRFEESPGPTEDRSPEKSGPFSGPFKDRSRTKNNYSTLHRKDVYETRNAGERGGPGGERREASPPSPHDPNDRRGYGTEAALPGQMILPAIEVADQELEPVATEASAPELGSPAIAVEVLVDPVPVTAPPPEVGSPPAATNVVPIGVPPVAASSKRATRWTLPAVPPDWIEAGHAKREALGLPPADLEKQARRFVAYYTSADCRKPARKDWPASWMKFALDEDLPAYRMNGANHAEHDAQFRNGSGGSGGGQPSYNDGACAYLAKLLNGGG